MDCIPSSQRRQATTAANATLEAALDRASEIKRKSYRESLQNNRAQIELDAHRLWDLDD